MNVCRYVMYVCVCLYVRTYVCMYVPMYVCTYLCMYVRTYVCMYVCTFEAVCYKPEGRGFDSCWDFSLTLIHLVAE